MCEGNWYLKDVGFGTMAAYLVSADDYATGNCSVTVVGANGLCVDTTFYPGNVADLQDNPMQYSGDQFYVDENGRTFYIGSLSSVIV